MSTGHIVINQNGTKTKLLVDPTSYQMVDIVDFAPRAVSGSPTYSTLGLYLDVAQEGFRHGYGQWIYGEPKSYAYTGSYVDTRHDHISLYTNLTSVYSNQVGWQVNDLITMNGAVLIADQQGLSVIRPTDGAKVSQALGAGHEGRNFLSNGKYLYMSSNGTMRIIYVGYAKGDGTATTVTFEVNFEENDFWKWGSAWVVDSNGVTGTPRTIESNTYNTITVGNWTNGNPVDGSLVILMQVAGVGANSPRNFSKMSVFGGSCWAVEKDSHYLHFWSETHGIDAEGGGANDLAAVEVGPPGGRIINIFPFAHQLYVFREDGVWVVNEQDTDALAYDTLPYREQASNANGKVAVVYNGFLVYSIRNTLNKYKSGIQDITPPVFNEEPPYKTFGNFAGGVVRGKYLYVLGQSNAAYSGEAAEVGAGFVSLLCHDGVGWHKLLTLPTASTKNFNIWLDPTYDRLYLYALDGANAGYLWYIQLQTYSDLPYTSYAATGNLYTSYFNMGFGRINKSFASLTLQGDFPPMTNVQVAYRTDDQMNWTVLGTYTADMQEINFPVGTTGKKIQYRLTLNTSVTFETPIVKTIISKVMLRPQVLYGITCDVIISNNLSDQHGLMLGHTAKELKQALQAARDSVSPIQLTDLHGDTTTVYLSSLRFSTIVYEDTDAVQSVARVTFVNV